jgi:hypothetical protein
LSSCILFWDNHTIVPGKVVQPLPPPLFSIKDTWRLFRVWLPDSSTWKCMYVLQISTVFHFWNGFHFAWMQAWQLHHFNPMETLEQVSCFVHSHIPSNDYPTT